MEFYKMYGIGKKNDYEFETSVVIEKEHRDLLIRRKDKYSENYIMPDYPEPVPLTLRLQDPYVIYKGEYPLYFSHYPAIYPYAPFILCMSTALKNVFSRFVLPVHRFYSATVTKPETGEKKSDYWILLIKETYYSEIHFPGTAWNLYDRKRKKIVKHFEKGEAKSIVDIARLEKQYVENDEKAGFEPLYTFYPTILAYQQSFDLIPWVIGEMYISQPFKNAIEEAGLSENMKFKLLDDVILTGYKDE